MQRILSLVTIALLAAGLCSASVVVGYISDEGCALNESSRNPQCAKNCISNGATAVLVTDEGKVYAIAEQDKIKGFAGEVVSITGEVSGEKITKIEKAVIAKANPDA